MRFANKIRMPVVAFCLAANVVTQVSTANIQTNGAPSPLSAPPMSDNSAMKAPPSSETLTRNYKDFSDCIKGEAAELLKEQKQGLLKLQPLLSKAQLNGKSPLQDQDIVIVEKRSEVDLTIRHQVALKMTINVNGLKTDDNKVAVVPVTPASDLIPEAYTVVRAIGDAFTNKVPLCRATYLNTLNP